MPAYVRRQPLTERIKSYLNPFDFLLWLSEEIESSGWDELEKEWAIPIGVGLNVVFIIARANSKSTSKSYDDIFADVQGPGLLAWVVSTDYRQDRRILSLTGHFSRTFSDAPLRSERLLHFLAQETLPSLRSRSRCCSKYSFSATSPCRFLSSHLITLAISV